MLKADFHIHSSEDPVDNISYSAKDVIRLASRQKFDVLSITHHWQCYFNRDLSDYARKKGILLIPGMEAKLLGKYDVLILGKKLSKNVSNFEQLKKIRESGEVFTIAPHPFYPIKSALNKKFFTHHELIDALEFGNFYCSWFDPNKEGIEIAKKYKKPLVGSSDAHDISFLGNTYSLIDSKKDKDSVFEAIRKNKIKVVSKPYSSPGFVYYLSSMFLHGLFNKRSRVKDYS